MEKASILNQMEQYDFTTPINVTMIFDDNDDETIYKNILTEQNRNNNNNLKKECLNVTSKTKSTKKVLTKDSVVTNKSKNSKDTPPLVQENKLTESSLNFLPDIDSASTETIRSQLNSSINNCKVTKTSNNTCKTQSQPKEVEELSGPLKKLLDVVSEHLIIIMTQYYHWRNQAQSYNCNKALEIANRLKKLKAHFFDLSYSTVVSILLSQEKNEWFTEKFLEKTVADANKVLHWKCERRHVEPFYIEMIEWVKQKRSHLETLGLKGTIVNKNIDRNINENRLLRERLADPPRPFYQLHTNAPNESGVRIGNSTGGDISSASDSVMNTDNSMCIFSSGTPGSNISISINRDMLADKTRQHYMTMPQDSTTITQASSNTHMYSSNSLVGPKQSYYNQHINHLEQNGYPQRYTIHNRPITPRPPPYFGTPHHKISSAALQNYKQINDNIGLTIQNYHQTQPNMNSLAASVCTDPNLDQMYYTQIKEHVNTTPVITHVTSLNPSNPMSFPTSGLCCICGENTRNNCSYCSALCQELGVGNTIARSNASRQNC